MSGVIESFWILLLLWYSPVRLSSECLLVKWISATFELYRLTFTSIVTQHFLSTIISLLLLIWYYSQTSSKSIHSIEAIAYHKVHSQPIFFHIEYGILILVHYP
jgi:hypothetical protein